MIKEVLAWAAGADEGSMTAVPTERQPSALGTVRMVTALEVDTALEEWILASDHDRQNIALAAVFILAQCRPDPFEGGPA